MPILDKLLGKNPYCPVKFPTFANAAQFCAQRLTERISNADRMKGQSDFLGSFLEAKITYPDIVGDNEVVGYLLLNVRNFNPQHSTGSLERMLTPVDSCWRRYGRAYPKGDCVLCSQKSFYSGKTPG